MLNVLLACKPVSLMLLFIRAKHKMMHVFSGKKNNYNSSVQTEGRGVIFHFLDECAQKVVKEFRRQVVNRLAAT